MRRHLLVTGGAGFIGSNFSRFVLRHHDDCRITILDCLAYSGNLDNIRDLLDGDRCHFVRGNILDEQLVAKLVDRCDAVVHFAAESHVDRSISDTRPFFETNVLGTQVLLEAIRRTGGRRLLHVSTDEVYGSLPLEPSDLQFSEESPLAPNNPYSASKAASDLIVRAYHRTYGIDAVVTRCSNNFGPFQFPEKIIPLFITRLMQGQRVPVYGDGRNVRDWIHVDDHAEAILAVLEGGTSGEVYNIGADNERSNLELTRTILDCLGLDESRIQFVADRLGHDRRYAIDSSKVFQELGWRASRSLWPGAMHDTVRWYVRNHTWWTRIQDGSYRLAPTG